MGVRIEKRYYLGSIVGPLIFGNSHITVAYSLSASLTSTPRSLRSVFTSACACHCTSWSPFKDVILMVMVGLLPASQA